MGEKKIVTNNLARSGLLLFQFLYPNYAKWLEFVLLIILLNNK